MAVLANVTQEILKVAEDEVSKIKADAQAEADRILADATSKIAEIEEKEAKKRDEEIERLKRQEISSAELESKKIVLAKKKEVLAKAFDQTLSDLENAPADKKLEQYKAMVKKVKDVIPNPTAVMSPKDSFTAEQLGVSKVVTDDRVAGGLILQSEDGQVEVDMQYSTILQSIWNREIKTVSSILFG
jgi:V/A-type H+-transporting ATPase subunit E